MEKIAVLLINYRQWELTRQCLESLERSRGVEVHPVLVDNGSPGDVPDWVAEVPRSGSTGRRRTWASPGATTPPSA